MSNKPAPPAPSPSTPPEVKADVPTTEELLRERDELRAMVAGQAATIKAHDSTKGDRVPLVQLADGTYQVIAGTSDPATGQRYTRHALAGNAALCDTLIKKGFPGLKKIS
jgi:hypothetical protein